MWTTIEELEIGPLEPQFPPTAASSATLVEYQYSHLDEQFPRMYYGLQFATLHL
jgi:hypothetical protein